MILTYAEAKFLARLLGHHFVGGGEHPSRQFASDLSDKLYYYCDRMGEPHQKRDLREPLPDLKVERFHMYGDRVVLTFEKGN